MQMVATTPVAGIFAPIAMSTWMSSDTTVHGPTMDSNPVFDSIVTVADPTGTFTVELTLPTVTSPETVNQPGDSFTPDWKFTFSGWAEGSYLAAPYLIEMTLGRQTNRDGVDDRWPHTYEEWTWGSTCTNTQWGATPASADDPTPVLANVDIACTAVDGTLILSMVDDLTSDAWSTF